MATSHCANKRFPTLIGTVEYIDGRKIAVADLPGLIDGAHLGKGYGHHFLHMIERNSCHLMVVDIFGFRLNKRSPYRTPFDSIALLSAELEIFNDLITEKPMSLVVTKKDAHSEYLQKCH